MCQKKSLATGLSQGSTDPIPRCDARLERLCNSEARLASTPCAACWCIKSERPTRSPALSGRTCLDMPKQQACQVPKVGAVCGKAARKAFVRVTFSNGRPYRDQ